MHRFASAESRCREYERDGVLVSYGTARQSNVFHLPPSGIPRPLVNVPDRVLIESYEMHAEDYLVACLTGATPNIIIERAERMFHAREALRKKGIALKP
jgi:hypothetical protein